MPLATEFRLSRRKQALSALMGAALVVLAGLPLVRNGWDWFATGPGFVVGFFLGVAVLVMMTVQLLRPRRVVLSLDGDGFTYRDTRVHWAEVDRYEVDDGEPDRPVTVHRTTGDPVRIPRRHLSGTAWEVALAFTELCPAPRQRLRTAVPHPPAEIRNSAWKHLRAAGLSGLLAAVGVSILVFDDGEDGVLRWILPLALVAAGAVGAVWMTVLAFRDHQVVIALDDDGFEYRGSRARWDEVTGWRVTHQFRRPPHIAVYLDADAARRWRDAGVPPSSATSFVLETDLLTLSPRKVIRAFGDRCPVREGY